MPLFTLPKLPASFVEEAFAPDLRERIGNATAFRLRVLSSEKRIRTVIVFARVMGHSKQIVEPDWRSTVFDSSLWDELKISSLGYVCVYDRADHHFLPMEITEAREDADLWTMTGIVGWKTISSQFEVIGLSPTNQNLVLKALDGSACRSVSLHPGMLPDN